MTKAKSVGRGDGEEGSAWMKVRWERGPRRGHEVDPKKPPEWPEHWTAWDGERHVGSLVCLGEGIWSMHVRYVGGWIDGPLAYCPVSEALVEWSRWVQLAGIDIGDNG